MDHVLHVRKAFPKKINCRLIRCRLLNISSNIFQKPLHISSYQSRVYITVTVLRLICLIWNRPKLTDRKLTSRPHPGRHPVAPFREGQLSPKLKVMYSTALTPGIAQPRGEKHSAESPCGKCGRRSFLTETIVMWMVWSAGSSDDTGGDLHLWIEHTDH